MPDAVPILVCGLGRCGTSAVMRMLDVAGVPVLADGDNAAYEHGDFEVPHSMDAEYGRLCGRAVKILVPHRWGWPSSFPAQVIWLHRDEEEQAKSQMKFLRWQGARVPERPAKALVDSLLPDTAAALRIFDRIGVDLLEISFEELVTNPHKVAADIARHLGIPEKADAMASVVIVRHPRCAPDMRIEESAVSRVLTHAASRRCEA